MNSNHKKNPEFERAVERIIGDAIDVYEQTRLDRPPRNFKRSMTLGPEQLKIIEHNAASHKIPVRKFIRLAVYQAAIQEGGSWNGANSNAMDDQEDDIPEHTPTVTNSKDDKI